MLVVSPGWNRVSFGCNMKVPECRLRQIIRISTHYRYTKFYMKLSLSVLKIYEMKISNYLSFLFHFHSTPPCTLVPDHWVVYGDSMLLNLKHWFKLVVHLQSLIIISLNLTIQWRITRRKSTLDPWEGKDLFYLFSKCYTSTADLYKYQFIHQLSL